MLTRSFECKVPHGFVDGLFGGAILGWLYNFIVDRS